MVRRSTMFGLGSAVAFSAAVVYGAPSTPAVLTVVDSVVTEDVEPLGANIGTVMGGTNYTTNQLMRGTGFEPAYDRWLRRVDRCGPNWVEWDGDGGVHFWDQCSTGFGNGATIRIYRIVDARGAPLAWATGAPMENPAGADHVIFVGEFTVPMPGGSLPRGGWVAEGSRGSMNRVHLDRNATLYRGDYLFITFKKFQLLRSEINSRLYQYNSNIESVGHLFRPSAWNARIVPHPSTPLPQAFLDEDPGEGCYELTATNSNRENVGQWLFHAYDQGEGQWYGALIPGARYRCEVWLRQEGLGNGGRVRFNSNQRYSSISQTWTVTNTWQKYTYDFTGPAYPDGDPWHHYLGLEVTGPGKLWIDNWKVFQNDAVHENRAFAPCTVGYNEYLRSITPFGRKPSARFYPTTFPTVAPMERRLSDWDCSKIDFINNLQPGIDITIPHCLYWAYKSGTNPETRIVPYFTLRVEDLEAEWKALVEYLGVPYDPSTDSPQTKPYAYMRYRQRGVGRPWTEEFREIIIEYGNESWHNGAGGYGWYGFSRPGWVWAGGIEYGLFARYMFDEQVARMPWWTQYNLGRKIKFALSGGYMVGADQYGEVSVRRTLGAVKYVTHANYVGPKWETGEEPNSVYDDDGVQRTLVAASPDFKSNYLAKHRQFRDEAAAMGINYDLIIYEGGPSGYVVGGGTPTQQAVSEAYGKSMAMAVAALDAWLYSNYVGYKHQNYLGYGCGTGWSSHTQFPQGGFRQHCGWMAMALRNNHARGDQMLKTTFTSQPTYTDAAVCPGEIPLIAAYALRNRERTVYSVFVLSRKLGGTHNGTNFGDGFTPLTINLPFSTRPQAIYLHRMARRNGAWTTPHDNNRDSQMVVIRSEMINTAAWSQSFVVNASTGADARGLPPGNIFLYVFALDTVALAIRGNDPAEMLRRAMADPSFAAEVRPYSTPQAAPVSRSAGAGTAQMRWMKVAARSQPAVRGVSSVEQELVGSGGETAAAVGASMGQASAVPTLASPPAVVTPETAPTRVALVSPLPPSLAVKAVSASSFFRKHLPSNAVDGSAVTRWTPSGVGYQWFACDLGFPRTVAAAAAVWYRRNKGSATAVVTTSQDGVTWELAWRGFLTGRGSQRLECTFAPREARYVRFSVETTDQPLSFAEVGIYASARELVAME